MDLKKLIMQLFSPRLQIRFKEMEHNVIKVDIMEEKRSGHGEDAPPLLIQKERACAVGVFDGMGGAGASTCHSDYGEGHTQAYVASRIVKEELNRYLEANIMQLDISSDTLKELLQQRLCVEKEKSVSVAKSQLRSKLVREYPTTMALVILHEQDSKLIIDSYWAGDSRCYFWTKDGLYQISIDDLDCDNDPLENLRNDAALSNCVCADRDFHINHKRFCIPREPISILSATDGCFGYYPTPMHFEHILKKCLRKATDATDWRSKVIAELQKVTGDDVSLALIGYGYDSFEMFKKQLWQKRVEGMSRIRELEDSIEKGRKSLAEKEKEYEKSILEGWYSYQRQYMKYLNNKDNAEG